MTQTLTVRFPKELTDLVAPDKVVVLGHGTLYEAEEKEPGKEFLIYREHNIIESTNWLNVSKEFVKQRGLKPGYTVAFVEYPMNGRQTIDIFKIGEE